MSYPFLLQLLNQIRPGWEAEYRFHPPRRWRFDFANPQLKLGIEIDGGVWIMGRHSRGKGQIADFEKGNTACLDGWSVLHFTPQQAGDGTLTRFVHYMLNREAIGP